MTDFYKKLYGYEDDIKLRDDDIKILEEGMLLKKMNANKEEFNDRFYRFDSNNNQLVASTKEFRKKEKIYQVTLLNEVKAGCSSDNLKSYKLKKSINDKKKVEDMEDVSFVIVFDNYKKSLDLMAPNETERNRWVRVLSYFIVLTKKRKGVLPETDKIMRNYFEIADKTNDKKVNKNEVTAFLDSINLKLKKDQLRRLIKMSDTNNDGELSEEEFEKFIQHLYNRKEMLSLFKLIATNGGLSIINFFPEFITVEQFRTFLERYQKEIKTEQECIELIQKFETSDLKLENKLSLYGFINYLTDLHQFIDDLDKEHNVYMNMNNPFSYYFINSSHNTYLSGDQITSESRPDAYIAAIMKGARLLELDCHDGSDGRPRIFHQKTLTNKILFEDVLIAVKEYAFRQSDYPLILTIELHCTPPQQRVMADLIKKHLKDYLFLDYYDNDNFPTLEQLKKKIFIRCGKPKKQNSEISSIIKESTKKDLVAQQSYDSLQEPEEEEEKNKELKDFEEIKELGDLVNLVQSASYKGIDYAFQNYTAAQTSSLSEKKCSKIIEEEDPNKIIGFTANYLIKVYPAFYRQDSSNLNPLDFWILGFQIAALNFQTKDTAMQLNEALFTDNGGCGYVLKPEILTNPSLKFNPFDTNTMHNKKIFDIKIISAQHLPRITDLVKDISDPYVKVSIYGVPADIIEKKTKTVHDNGFNPIWNEDLKFVINCPELAFVKFTVYDNDIGKDQIIGVYTIRFENIREGYRHIKLKNKESKGTIFVGIKIY